jgi:hypothetical protein
VRAVDRLVAAGGPAGAAGQERGVVTTTDQDDARGGLLLEVALETEILVPGLQHLGVDRAVRVVADHAALAGGLVLEDIRSGLLHVALGAGGVETVDTAAVLQDRVTLVRFMAITAGHLAGEHRVGVRQGEFTALVEMALEAGLRRAVRVHDIVAPAAGLGVQRAGSVTGFATDVLGIAALGHEFGVRRIVELGGDLLVTLGAFGRADEGGAGDTGWRDHGPVDHHAAHEEQAPDRGATEDQGALGTARFEFHGEFSYGVKGQIWGTLWLILMLQYGEILGEALRICCHPTRSPCF